MSLFSGLNQLKDISNDKEYAGLLGFTEEEIASTFNEHIEAWANQNKTTKERIVEQLREYYNGYQFGEGSDVKVYNPMSVILALTKKALDNY